ncbi:MAG: hypothetical protein P1V36_08235 [Planctomycetota bacterium]|nr:hypothetical protein [Planctomycetota bacterium]
MMRAAIALTCLALLLLSAPAVRADDEAARKGAPAPTSAEIAALILDGNAGEHALVAAWLDGADRAQLRAVFAQLRALRAARAARTGTGMASIPLRGDAPLPEPIVPPEGPLINAEVRIIDLPAPDVAALLGKHRPTADRAHHLLQDAEVKRLMRAIEEHAGAKVVSAPRITVYDRQKANVSVLNQVSFIQDYDVESSNGVQVADPIIGVLQEGILIDFTPTYDAKAETIRLAFEGTFSSLQRPIPEKEFAIAGLGEKVTIQLPQLEVGRIRQTVDLPDGGWVILGGNITFTAEKNAARTERVALIHLTKVELQDVAPRRGK